MMGRDAVNKSVAFAQPDGSPSPSGGAGGAGGGGTSFVPYATSADIRSRAYEGERSIAAILHMDEIVPHVLSFMSTVELMFMETFWSRIGLMDVSRFARIAGTYHSIVELNLAYCNFMPGAAFYSILKALPNHQQLTKLNLFYAYELTDDDIIPLVTQSLVPALRELNLGRVSKLTDRSVRSLAELPALTYLNLIHNHHISEETLMLFDDLTKFPALQVLNLMHCTKYRMEDIEELTKTCQASGRNAQLHRLGGTNIRFIGPQELFQIDKSGKKMRKDIDADT